MTPTVTLTERRPRVVRLPRAEITFLLAHARHLIDVVPTFERGRVRLTPRGFVGFLTGPSTRYIIRPKIPWPNLRLLLGLSPEAEGTTHEPGTDLLAVLATEFVDQLEAVTRPGLVAGYSEVETTSSFLRGKLRAAEQMRDAAARAFPDRFYINEPVFDLNAPWNQIPKATAIALLDRTELPLALRQRIESAVVPLASVLPQPVTERTFVLARAEPRAESYRPLLNVCRLILNGLASADPLAHAGSAFLIDLGQAFERYLTEALTRELAPHRAWGVEAQPGFTLGPTTLEPDIVICKRHAARVVLDAKWKTTTLDANDLHQVLAYATLTGAERVGLVYPGRTNARTHFTTPNSRVRVSRYRVRVIGDAAELARSIAKLARDCRRS